MEKQNEIDNIKQVLQCPAEVAEQLLALYGDSGTAIAFYLAEQEAAPRIPPIHVDPVKKVEEKKEEEKKAIDKAEVEQKKIEEAKTITIMPKKYTVLKSDMAKLTQWIEVPIEELVAYCKEQIKAFHINPQDYVCPICRMEYYENMLDLPEHKIRELDAEMTTGKKPVDVVLLSRCKEHFYHKQCIEELGKREGSGPRCLKCPLCNVIYGVYIGNMPEGHMDVKTFPKELKHCAGYESFGAIEITYSIPDGYQNGTRYKGTSSIIHTIGTRRNTFLPDCEEGREILKLLRTAFDRRLTFTVGTSVTTGKNNTVVWNGIHHKTSVAGGAEHYGYPDPGYFARVKDELASKGIYSDKV